MYGFRYGDRMIIMFADILKQHCEADSPGGSGGILLNLLVRCQQGHALDDCLTYQHPIKRILVLSGKFEQLEYGFFIQLQALNGMALTLRGDERIGRCGQWETSEGIFDRDFPA